MTIPNAAQGFNSDNAQRTLHHFALYHSSIIRFYVFFQNPKHATFYVFLKCNVKKR